MKQRIFILGASGQVGRELIKQIVEKDGNENHKNPTEIVGIADSRYFLFDSAGIILDMLEYVSLSKENFTNALVADGDSFNHLDKLLQAIKKGGLEGEVIFVDVTPGKERMLDFHKQIILNSGNSLVVGNKNPLSISSFSDFLQLTKYHGRYHSEATIMGASGIVDFIVGRREIGDNLRSMKGVFSGTIGYILSGLDSGEDTFSELVRSAYSLGYSEPDIYDDINGLDVARKLVILSRYAGYDTDISDVEIDSLIPHKYSDYKGKEFFEKIALENENFASRVKQAKKKGKVLRYVGEMYVQEDDTVILQVGLKEVYKSSDIGSLEGAENIVSIETDICKAPLFHIIKSQGAGARVIGGVIRVGILKMLGNWISRI